MTYDGQTHMRGMHAPMQQNSRSISGVIALSAGSQMSRSAKSQSTACGCLNMVQHTATPHRR